MKQKKYISPLKKAQNQFKNQTVLNVFLFVCMVLGFTATLSGVAFSNDVVNDFFEEEQTEQVFISKDAGNSYTMDCHSFFSHELLSDLLEVEETKTETKNEIKDAYINEYAIVLFQKNSVLGSLKKVLFLHLLHDFETRKHISLFVLHHSWRSLLA